jgi:hypothetical protein
MSEKYKYLEYVFSIRVSLFLLKREKQAFRVTIFAFPDILKKDPPNCGMWGNEILVTLNGTVQPYRTEEGPAF